MIKPNIYTDLDNCIIKISSDVIRYLTSARSNTMKYNTLLDKLKLKYGEDIYMNINIVFSFLYLIGKVDYNLERDMVVLLNEN